jgi:peptidyl-prolyl cis-trans isomerase SurA
MHLSQSLHRRAFFFSSFLILLLLLLLPACSRKPASEREVWAEVDGQPTYRDQVERIYRSRTTQGSDTSNPDQALSLKLSILNELINNQILLAHASHSRITVSEAEVDTRVAELQSPYSKEEFQKKLQDQGMEPGDLRQEVRQSLMIDKLINKEITSHLAVTEAEIAQYYERNKANFNVPETEYHLAQIAVTPVPDPEVRNLKNDDAKNPAAAERKIKALYAQLQSGEDFSKVAQEYSEDPRTASGGGDMGFISASTLNANPQLKQAVTSLKVGQISGIIRTSTGYHILKLLSREEAGQHQLADPEVQSSIRQTMMNEKEQLLKQAYIEVLRNRAKVVNYLAQQIVEAGPKRPARK